MVEPAVAGFPARIGALRPPYRLCGFRQPHARFFPADKIHPDHLHRIRTSSSALSLPRKSHSPSSRPLTVASETPDLAARSPRVHRRTPLSTHSPHRAFGYARRLPATPCLECPTCQRSKGTAKSRGRRTHGRREDRAPARIRRSRKDPSPKSTMITVGLAQLACPETLSGSVLRGRKRYQMIARNGQGQALC